MIKRALVALALASSTVSAAPSTFAEAKSLMRLIDPPTSTTTFYCGCSYQAVGRSGGRIDHGSCGYKTVDDRERAGRLEWEHVVTASALGNTRQCWSAGGRSRCQSSDAAFNRMEADLHNLRPSVGEVNKQRSNFLFDDLGPSRLRGAYGQCGSFADPQKRLFHPRPEIRGEIARTYFYMADRYGVYIAPSQQQLFIKWNDEDPVTAEERRRDARIARFMGHSNPFVTGEKEWTLTARPDHASSENASSVPVRGNARSKIYHVRGVCEGYDKMAPSNIVEFQTELEAQRAGYRKAGNCRG